MIRFKGMDPNCINSQGIYYDKEKNEYYVLSDGEVVLAREYFENPYLAYDRHIAYDNLLADTKGFKNKKFGLSREQKYNDGKWKSFNILNLQDIVYFGVGLGMSLLLMVYFYAASLESLADKGLLDSTLLGDEQVTVEDNQVIKTGNQIRIEDVLVQKYCRIYHVDYHQVMIKLQELTDNFEDEDYLKKNSIKNIVYKGQRVYGNSAEEIIIYAIRMIKHDPYYFDLEEDKLKSDGYESSTDYLKQVAYYAKVFQVDPVLMYAVMDIDTGFDDFKFNNYNNPAQLMNDGEWAVFATKEEGIIELAMELKRCQEMGIVSVEDLSVYHCPINHSQVNSFWVAKVKAAMQYANTHYEDLFGDKEKGAQKK